MSLEQTNERVMVTASGRRLGVSVQIGDVVVTVTGPAAKDVIGQSEDVVRTAALRLAGRALEVAQQEIRQEQG